MPKYNEDVTHAAYRFVEAINANDWLASPPYVRVDFSPIFGYEALEIRNAFRIRLPFITRALGRKRGRGRNRATVPACYLCLRWVDLNSDSPLWYLTERSVSKERQRSKGIYFDTDEQQWKVLIYQVVEDMNHLRRMFVHIFAQYQRERSRNEAIQREIEERMTAAIVFGPALSPAAKSELEAFQRWVGRRFENMGHIKGKLGGRADLVHYYAQRVEATLHGIAKTLEADAGNLVLLERTPSRPAWTFNVENFRTHLAQERAKLDKMVSRNIRSLRRSAQRRIDKALAVVATDRTAASLYLRDAAEKLRQAARLMEVWAETITPEEMEDANRYRGVVALP